MSAATAGGGSWLSVSPASGVTPATFTAIASPSPGMAPGTYTGTISVIPTYAGAVTQKVNVTLRVTSSGTITASPASLSFSYQPGSPFPNPQTLAIANSSGTPTSVNIFATTSGGGSWLVVSPGIANTPVNVIVSVNPAGLGLGVYYGYVNIAPATGGTATLIPVVLNTFNFSQLVISPTSLVFDYQSGGASPPVQYISATSTGSAINFTASVLGPNWISVSTRNGVTPTGVGVVVKPASDYAARDIQCHNYVHARLDDWKRDRGRGNCACAGCQLPVGRPEQHNVRLCSRRLASRCSRGSSVKQRRFNPLRRRGQYEWVLSLAHGEPIESVYARTHQRRTFLRRA